MADESKPWLTWKGRFRAEVKNQGSSLAKVAEAMGMAESTLRSWTNDNREVNLEAFFRLCEAAEVDPAIVLFGRPVMTEAQLKAFDELTASLPERSSASAAQGHQFNEARGRNARDQRGGSARADMTAPSRPPPASASQAPSSQLVLSFSSEDSLLMQRLRQDFADLSKEAQADLFEASSTLREIMQADPYPDERLEEKGWSAVDKLAHPKTRS